MGANKLLIRIGLLALIVRFAYFLQHAASPFFARPLLDQHYYDLCARQLVGAGGDLIDGFRPLLYPLFLSLFYRMDMDGGMLLSILTQHILGIGMTVMVAWLTMRLFDNTKAGMVAGLLFCFSAPPLYFEGELLIATLFSFLLLLLWIVVFQALESGSFRRAIALWLASGLVLGLAAQARPNALPLLLVFPLLSLARVRGRRDARDTEADVPQASRLPAWHPLLALVGLLLIQSIFGLMNARYSGHFSLMTQAGGINFYLGNSQKADGMIPRQSKHVAYEGEYRDPIQVMAEQGYLEHRTAEQGILNQEVSQRDISNFWKNKTLQEIKTDPTHWLGLMAKKSWLMLWSHEEPNNRSLSFAAREETPLLRWLPVHWWLLLALLPWGLAALIQKKRCDFAFWAIFFIVLFSATVVLFFVNSRFRIPLWPGLAILGGGGAIHLGSSLREANKPGVPQRNTTAEHAESRRTKPFHTTAFFCDLLRDLRFPFIGLIKTKERSIPLKPRGVPLVPIICSIALLLLSSINWFGIPPDPIENDLSMRANAYYDQGRYEEALPDILECIKMASNNPRYPFTLGNILLAQEKPELAIQAYLKALALDPSDPMFHNNIGIAFEDAGEPDKAVIAYRKALELRPGHRAAQTNLFLLLIQTDDLDQAEALLEQIPARKRNTATLHCAQWILKYKKTGEVKFLLQAESINKFLARQLANKNQTMPHKTFATKPLPSFIKKYPDHNGVL